MLVEFNQFRAREGQFNPGNYVHKESNVPILERWRHLANMNVELAFLAKRLFGTIANSVPAERSFSATKFIHSKARNSLHPAKTDQLVFIYMNSRVLRRLEEAGKAPSKIIKPVVENTWATADESVLLELEDDIVEDGSGPNLEWFEE